MPKSAVLAMFVAVCACAHARAQDQKPTPHTPVVQIALLLDTSNSMDGLIGQAKSQLWKVVNEFAGARRDGVRPELQIALYEYGKQSLDGREHWIRLISPLTTDLDKVSEALFALNTNGGDEYCGAVIGRAVDELQWSQSRDALKMIFIAGNEPFTQGPVDFRDSVRRAVQKGITVNTIHCGPESEGTATGWRDGAVLAQGSFLSIDSNRVVRDIAAPQDAELARLNAALNRTYLAYGARGRESYQRQAAQDANAARMSAGSLSTRAASKASALYDNSGWDLVDAARKGKVEVEELKAEEMPAEMRAMSAAERKAFVEQKVQEREAIQKSIAELSKKRAEYVAREQKKRAGAEADSLDSAMIKAVHAQASRSHYVFE